MASAPPRSRLRSSNSTSSFRFKSKSNLEVLEQMGFPRERAEKAIAATGNKDVARASEWLLSHVNDPALDKMEPREYIIYLFPTGEFLETLMDFWDTTLQVCGWNSAHLYHPHVTLCSFFKIPHSKIDVVDKLMEVAESTVREWPRVKPLELDLFTKNKNFIGYFLVMPHHQLLEQLMIKLKEEADKLGIEFKPQRKQMHLTLAFQYDESHHDLLLKLAEEMNTKGEALWEMRVYSREAHTKMAEVRKVIKDYTAAQDDELDLKENGFVYMDPEEHEKSPDGWYKGTLHKTGITNLFPGNFTVKCSQMEIWTLHRHLVIPFPPYKPTHNDFVHDDKSEKSNEAYDNIWSAEPPEGLYAKVKKLVKVTGHPRRIFVARHGERCDFAFNRTWFEKSFDSFGKYARFNLNCPASVVKRSSFRDYERDCPLTEIGKAQAKIVGEAMREANHSVRFVYSSPSLRCVETATELLKGMTSPCKMCIEPALFEWLGWYKPGMPNFIPPTDLLRLGFPVEASYVPHTVMEDIPVNESIADYYNRSNRFVKDLVLKLKPEGGNILLVGHSGTTDACLRQLQGKPIRNYEEFRNIVRSCPYCCIVMAQEDRNEHWSLSDCQLPTLTHLANREFSWQSLL